MKKLALMLLLLSTVSFAAQTPNPADYPLNVRVATSRVQTDGGGNLLLGVIIDGKQYELEGVQGQLPHDGWVILALGDYKARVVKDEPRSAGRFTRNYEFIFPDNKTMKFNLIGILE